MSKAENRFHFQDGWFFSRLSDGSVQIEKREPPRYEGNLVIEVFIPPEAWALIVAQVSEGGETAGRWHTMLDFHGVEEGESGGDLPPTWEGK